MGDYGPVFAAGFVYTSDMLARLQVSLVVMLISVHAHVTRVTAEPHEHSLVETVAWFGMGPETAGLCDGVGQWSITEPAVMLWATGQYSELYKLQVPFFVTTNGCHKSGHRYQCGEAQRRRSILTEGIGILPSGYCQLLSLVLTTCGTMLRKP